MRLTLRDRTYGLRVTAWTLIKISSSPGVGMGFSVMIRVLGLPPFTVTARWVVGIAMTGVDEKDTECM